MKLEKSHILNGTAGNATLTHSSSLMTNYESGKVASPGRHVTAVTDKNGNPMVFTISTNEGKEPSAIYLTYRNEGVSTGWAQIDVTKTLPVEGLQCRALSVTQYADGSITMAVAAAAAQTGPSQLFVTSQLPDDPSGSEWQDLTSHWMTRTVPSAQSGSEIDAISMTDAPSGISTDGSGPLMFVAAKSGGKTVYYIVGTGPTDPTTWTEVAPPDGALSVSQVLPGNSLVASAGAYALYEHGQGAQVGFQGAPGQFVSQKFTLDVSAETQAIATGRGKSGYNSLFLAGAKGLQYFAPVDLAGNASPQTIVGGDQFNGLKELAVTEETADDGAMTVWMLDANDNLYYLTANKSDPTKSVNGPFLFKQAVAQIASIQNHVHGASEVILVSLDGKLSYLWQDPATTLWTEQSIALYTTDENLSFTCYTTALHFEDDGGTAVSTKADIRASAWSFATINGSPYVLTPDTPVTVDTDANGAVTIVQKVNKLSVPNYTVASNDLDGPVTILPSACIKADLAKVQNGGDLSSATNQVSGAPIFTKNPKFDYDDAATALGKLTSLHPDDVASGASVVKAASVTDFANAVSAPANGTWALMRNTNGNLVHVEGASADAHVTEVFGSSIWDDITTTAGDGLRWLEHAVEDVVSIVVQAVDGIVKFAIKIGKDIVKFVVSVAEQVFAAVSYVLKQIGAAIEKVIQWIGFLFDWGDIVTAHNAISAYVMKGFEFLDEEIDGAEDKVSAFFDNLKSQFNAALQIPATTPSGPINNKSGKLASTNSLMKTPGGSFSSYHMQHSGVLSGNGDIATKGAGGLVDWVSNMMSNEFSDIKTDFMAAAQQIADLQKNNTLTAENVAKIVLEVIGDAVLDTLKNVVVGAMEFAKFILDAIKTGATTKINIPFLSALYKDISGNDLTLLDGISLLIAVPTTLIFKLAANRAPYSDADVAAIQAASVSQLFGPALNSAGDEATDAGAAATAIYGDIGTITAGVGGIIAMICSVVSAQSEEDVPLVPKVTLATSLIVLFMNFPVQKGAAQPWNIAGFTISTFMMLFGGLTYLRKELAEQDQAAVAAVGLVAGVLSIVPQTGALIATAESEAGADALSYVSYFCSLFSDTSTICGGAAKLDVEEVTKEILVVVAFATGGLAGFGKMAVGAARSASA